jgi:hypothetical protein
MGGGVSLVANIFGEGAVSLSSLGISSCGGVYNVSVVTRTTATGNGEAKDYIGGIYDFGSLTVTGSLTPSCQAEFGYSAQAKDQAGNDLNTGVDYNWSCNNGDLTWSGKAGTQTNVLPATYNCSVTASFQGCIATKTDLSVNVYAPVGASANLDPSCTLIVPYSGSGSAGSGSYSFAWTFSGACSGSSTAASGTVTLASPGGNCTGNLTVTDAGRADDLVCTATANDSAVGYVPLAVTPSLTQTCNMGVEPNVDDATYGSTVTGGSPAGVSYNWGFGSSTSGCTVTPSSSTTASGGLDVTPPSSRGPCNVNGSVTVTDLRTDKVCTATGGPANTTVYAPIKVSIAPNNTSLACTIPGTPGSDPGTIGPITFSPTVSGGDGSYTYQWHVSGPNDATCGTTASCVVDIPDASYCALTQLYVGVDDGTPLCALQNSETEDVTKQTQIFATNK